MGGQAGGQQLSAAQRSAQCRRCRRAGTRPAVMCSHCWGTRRLLFGRGGHTCSSFVGAPPSCTNLPASPVPWFSPRGRRACAAWQRWSSGLARPPPPPAQRPCRHPRRCDAAAAPPASGMCRGTRPAAAALAKPPLALLQQPLTVASKAPNILPPPAPPPPPPPPCLQPRSKASFNGGRSLLGNYFTIQAVPDAGGQTGRSGGTLVLGAGGSALPRGALLARDSWPPPGPSTA